MKVAGSNPAIGILYFMQKYPKGYGVIGNTTGFDPVISSSNLDISVCRMEKLGLSRQVHALKIGGSNPTCAIKELFGGQFFFNKDFSHC